MRIGFVFGSLALFCLAGSYGDAQAGAPKKSKLHHPHLHHALFELREAHKELSVEPNEFGGHKQKAMFAIHTAAKRIEVILTSLGDSTIGTPTKRDMKELNKKYKNHPLLHHALHELKHAHHQIKEDKQPYGTHKQALLQEIHFAIVELEALLHHKK